MMVITKEILKFKEFKNTVAEIEKNKTKSKL